MMIVVYTDIKMSNAMNGPVCVSFTSSSGLFPSDHAGIIRTALANMDREAREHYTVVIQAKDMAGQVGGLSGSTTINITLTDVNDNPPKFPQSTFRRQESSLVPSQMVQMLVILSLYSSVVFSL